MTVSRAYLGYEQVASMLHVLPGTIRAYHSHGRMPPPDVTVGKIPGWKPETIVSWAKNRPGRGSRTDRLEQRHTTKKDS